MKLQKSVEWQTFKTNDGHCTLRGSMQMLDSRDVYCKNANLLDGIGNINVICYTLNTLTVRQM